MQPEASGIGRACALAFARYGTAKMVIADIDMEAAGAVAAECRQAAPSRSGFSADAVSIDVRQEDSVNSALALAARTLGRIDYCVNAAGVSTSSHTCVCACVRADPAHAHSRQIPSIVTPSAQWIADRARASPHVKIGVQLANEVAEASVAEFEQMLAVNVTGTFLVTRAASAQMKAQELVPAKRGSPERGMTRGCIVNLGSASAFMATPKMVQYTAAKHAALGVTRNAGTYVPSVPQECDSVIGERYILSCV